MFALLHRFGLTGLRIALPGRRQLELWFAPHGTVIPPHIHPDLESWLVFLGGRMRWYGGPIDREFTWRDIGQVVRVPAGRVHGAVTRTWGLFANWERWLPGVAKTSAAENLELRGPA